MKSHILINYADRLYEPARKWNSWTGKYVAKFDKIYSFSPQSIDLKFKEANRAAFSNHRGNGLWLWKPYIINKVINESNDGDVIFYCDSASFFIRRPSEIFNKLTEDNPLFVCDLPLLESCWTKPLCFNKMELNDDRYRYSNQIMATYFVFILNDFTRRFMNEWLELCCDFSLLKPEGLAKGEKILKNYGKTFVSHREDQSIFSLLCKKYGICPPKFTHKDISQRGKTPLSYYSEYFSFNILNHPDDTYSPVLYIHKTPSLFTRRFFIGLYKYIKFLFESKVIL